MASILPDDQPVYLAMVEENGLPKLGATATTLGVRLGKDIDVDSDGNVHMPDFTSQGKNGVSCSPTIEQLPPFALPIEWGGSHKKTEVWRIDIRNLGPDLVAQQDGPNHISIGPSRSMTFEEFERAIRSTVTSWQRVV